MLHQLSHSVSLNYPKFPNTMDAARGRPFPVLGARRRWLGCSGLAAQLFDRSPTGRWVATWQDLIRTASRWRRARRVGRRSRKAPAGPPRSGSSPASVLLVCPLCRERSSKSLSLSRCSPVGFGNSWAQPEPAKSWRSHPSGRVRSYPSLPSSTSFHPKVPDLDRTGCCLLPLPNAPQLHIPRWCEPGGPAVSGAGAGSSDEP
jgi:hypothetical protein